MVRSTINSRKHIVQFSPLIVALGGINPIPIAEAVQGADGTDRIEVVVGSVIKAVFVEIWCTSDNPTEVGSCNITVEKSPSGLPDMSFVNSQDLFAYPNKNNVLYITQGLVAEGNGTPIPFVRQWIPIPKGKQRMSLGDRIMINIAGITGVQVCMVHIYKEYF